jgi:hypothetical protein
MINGRLEKIDEWRWFGQSSFVRDAESKTLCDRTLARDNIHWRWADRWRDEYEIGMAAGFSEPAWQELGQVFLNVGPLVLREAKFDFDNSGSLDAVFAVSVEDKGASYQWYMVAVPDEVDLLRQKLLGILANAQPLDALAALAKDLQFPVRDRRWSTFNGGLFAHDDGSEPSLKSRLYDTSNTESYEGWYTKSRVVRFAEKTYFFVSSVGNTIGPSVAIFRPRPDGGMSLVCSHKAIPSYTRRDIQSLDQAYACPVDLQQRRVPWQGDKTDVQTAILDLPEWGGSRPVTQWSGSVGPELRTRLSIGSVDATEADTAGDWPMSSVDENYQDTVELLLTEAGPYVEATSWIATDPGDDRQVSRLFYRIVGDKLILVCGETDVAVAPPGYAQGGEK